MLMTFAQVAGGVIPFSAIGDLNHLGLCGLELRLGVSIVRKS
ncbi:hypothetical protein [Romeriopsis navalis]|nr:hypothetical protein [Romeriopsis navalis]